MFQRLKNKLEEELKGPLRFPTSVQQIAQVISPSASSASLENKGNESAASNPLQDALAVPANFFSISDDQELSDSLRMHTVDLTANSPSILTSRSRRDSMSSIASDASSMFPIYESPLNHSLLQGEWESELDESTSRQLEKISKEKLYQGYQKLLSRYDKYKGRFMDLSKAHKNLQYENIKMKNVLQESQDTALRRMAELREQCQLEQKAKAHLEESLRNDLEERDHVITTLNTKISLLKSAKTPDGLVWDTGDPGSSENTDTDLLKLETSNVSNLSHSPQDSVKQTITQLKSGMVRLKSENENLTNLLSKSPEEPLINLAPEEPTEVEKSQEKDKKIEKLNGILLKCKEKINSLNEDVQKRELELAGLRERLQKSEEEKIAAVEKLDTVQKREEEAGLSIAENKMAIHSELQAKEALIAKLTSELEESRTIEKEFKKAADEKLAHYQQEIRKLQEDVAKTKDINENMLQKIRDQREKISDGINLQAEKQRLEANVQSFLNAHQTKLNQVLDTLESKLSATEGHLVRLCADSMISYNASQVQLKQQGILLDAKCADAEAKIADLEGSVKSLQLSLEGKDCLLLEKDAELEKLTAELHEKIDRFCQLGDELAEAKTKIEILEDDLEHKSGNSSQEISELENKLAALQKRLSDSEYKLTGLEEENNKLKVNFLDCERVKQEKEESLVEEQRRLSESLSKISSLEKKIKDIEAEKTKIEEILEQHVMEVQIITSQNDKTTLKLRESLSAWEVKEKEYQEESMENKTRVERLLEEVEVLKNQLQDSQENADMNVETRDLLGLEQAKVQCLVSDKAVLENQLKKLEAQLSDEKCNNETLKVELCSAKKTFEEEKSQLKDASETRVDKLELEKKENLEKVQALEKEVGETKKVVSDLEEEVSRWQNVVQEKEDFISSISISLKKREEDIEDLRERKTAVEEELRSIIAEMADFKEKSEGEILRLNEEKAKLEKEYATQSQKCVELQKSVDESQRNLEDIRRNNEELVETIRKSTENSKDLQNTLKEATTKAENQKSDLERRITALESDKQNLEGEITAKQETIVQYQQSVSETLEKLAKTNENLVEKEAQMEKLRIKTSESVDKSAIEISRLQKLLSESEVTIRKLSEEMEKRIQMESSNNQVESLMVELNSAKSELAELKKQHEAESASWSVESDSRVSILKNEIKFLNEKFEDEVRTIESNGDREISELREKLVHSEKMSEELLTKLEAVSAEKEELGVACEEKTMKLTELEACLADLKTDLDKNFNENGVISTPRFEELYEEKLHSVVSDYEVQIAKRDERIREIELELSDNKDSLEALKSVRQELRNLRAEVKEKECAVEVTSEQLQSLKKQSTSQLAQVRREHEEVLESERLRFEEKIKEEREELERRLVEERNAREIELASEKAVHESRLLTAEQEWATQRKVISHSAQEIMEWRRKSKNIHQDLESTSAVAVAAVGSGAESMEMLQRQIVQQAEEIQQVKKQHKREVLELSKLAAMRTLARNDGTQEGLDVEHEYLRNILFEYMMGREQTVLAKVLAAIVKFDSQQTQTILDHHNATSGLRIL